MSGNDSFLEWLGLSLLPGLGVSGAWRLINHFGGPAQVLNATAEKLLEVQGVRKNQVKSLIDDLPWAEQAEAERRKVESFGAKILVYDCPDYPPLLKQLVDPPLLLYILGDHSLLTTHSVAIVGSRAATGYGRRTSFQLAGGLAQYALTVVSGMALGIDTEAHRGCLHSNGSTIAVLGSGLDVVYPKQNRKLYDTIARCGAIVSEYPLGTRPEGFRFPARNRIIAGLSAGVVVVEAARRSGSLITAQMALDIGRDVFAVPGQVDSFKSEGAHWLLQQGAKLVASANDIVEEYNLSGTASAKDEKTLPSYTGELEPDAVVLLQLIDPYGTSREELIVGSELGSARVSELLLFLELEGLVEMLPGDRVRTIDT